jgi:DNA-binding NarL/FixJ family response regulator
MANGVDELRPSPSTGYVLERAKPHENGRVLPDQVPVRGPRTGPAVPPIAFRVFAGHPIATAQYVRVLVSEPGIQPAADHEPVKVGIFDSALSQPEASLKLARSTFPALRALLLTPSCDATECLRWLSEGFGGVVAYSRYEDELPTAVRHVAEGRLWVPAPVVARWMRMAASKSPSTANAMLSEREQAVVRCLERRLSNKEIAVMFGVTERTVKFHVSNILRKLNLRSRADIASSGVLPCPPCT